MNIKYEKMNAIKDKLETIKNTHPHLYSIWREYLLIKENNFLHSIEHLETVLTNIKNDSSIVDISDKLLLLTLCLHNIN